MSIEQEQQVKGKFRETFKEQMGVRKTPIEI